MNLSIIIVNYNVKYFLEQCLNSVLKAIQDIDSEIFVIDNASVDGSVEMLKQQFPDVNLIQNSENLGFSKANNQAISKAKGEYILLLNPDTIVEEDCFYKLLSFMSKNKNAGAIGVKMLNGEGKYLPESKRGFPSPSVAFYKFSGLARLFPKSKVFGQYYLSFLDYNEINEVDVLAGAFMFIRKSALEITGPLDEDFFMYGEDIDLSYRIQKAGFQNFYYPLTTIIHYKGESSKKNSLNYVFMFYKAMQIFAKKHFTKQKAYYFSILINLAIVFSATIAALKRFSKTIALPVIDGVNIFAIAFIVQSVWAKFIIYPDGGHFPAIFLSLIIPIYTSIWLGCMFIIGAYDKPLKLKKSGYGLFIGTLIILIIYALIPESYRFSRAIILISALFNFIFISISRILMNLFKLIDLDKFNNTRIIIIGDNTEYERLNRFYKRIKKTKIEGYVYSESFKKNDQFYLGKPEDLKDLINLHKIDELIFCSANFSTQEIISLMCLINQNTLKLRIAPSESKIIIGSNSITSIEDVFTYELNSINHPSNKRLKRLLDLLIAFSFILIFPLAVFKIKEPIGFIRNIFQVIIAKKTWVGYRILSEDENLPQIKSAVLYPADLSQIMDLEIAEIRESNLQYAKEYHLSTDISIIFNSFNQLGRK